MNILFVSVLLLAAVAAQAPPERHDPALAAFIQAAVAPGTNGGGREGQEALRRVIVAGHHNPAFADLVREVAAGRTNQAPNPGGHAAILGQLGAPAAPANHNAALTALNRGAGAPAGHNAALAAINLGGAGAPAGHTAALTAINHGGAGAPAATAGGNHNAILAALNQAGPVLGH